MGRRGEVTPDDQGMHLLTLGLASLPALLLLGLAMWHGISLTTHQNFPSFFVDRWNLGVIQRVLPNQRVEIRDYGWWDRGSCRVGLG